MGTRFTPPADIQLWSSLGQFPPNTRDCLNDGAVAAESLRKRLYGAPIRRLADGKASEFAGHDA